MKIDVHAHYMPAAFFGVEGRMQIRRTDSDEVLFDAPRGADTNDLLSNLETRFQVMERQGVDMHVLSTSPAPFHALEPRHGLDVCRAVNDALAATAAQHPDRFVAIATLPLQAPELAAQELERSVKDLNLRGAMIATHVLGKNLDDRALAPVWAKMQALDVPFFIHPSTVLGQERLSDYFLGNLLGNPTEDALAAASLIFGGVLQEFPRLKFLIAHGGGSCCALTGRWERGWRARADVRTRIPKPPSEYFRLLYFDSLVLSTPVLNFLVETAGPERVLLGTDYPFLQGVADNDPVQTIQSLPHQSNREKQLIFGGNAQELFKIS